MEAAHRRASGRPHPGRVGPKKQVRILPHARIPNFYVTRYNNLTVAPRARVREDMIYVILCDLARDMLDARAYKNSSCECVREMEENLARVATKRARSSEISR